MERRDTWTVLDAVRSAAENLERYGASPSARLDAELLLAHVLRKDRMALYIEHDRPLDAREREGYRALLLRRRAGEPVAYIRGEREFYGWPFFVDRRVLIPRPETELLVEASHRATERRGPGARVLDLGTGSGAVGISLGRLDPTARI